MKRFLLGNFTGITTSALVGYFWLYSTYQTNWRDVGKNDGSLDTSCR